MPETETNLATIAEEHMLPSIDPDALGNLGDERYVLFERGHYGQTWVSSHPTPDEAGNYTLNQEYAEDWTGELLLDRETGKLLRPASVVWQEVGTNV